MKTLTWLASYPKSGNTWARMFLSVYRSSGQSISSLEKVNAVTASESRYSDFVEISGRPRTDLTELEIDRMRESVQHRLAASGRSDRVYKTHNARVRHNGFPLIRREFTKSAIYVCRNPLDIVDSLADHVNFSHDEVIDLMNSPAHRMGGQDSPLVTQHLDTWSTHASSWNSATEFPLLLLRYEDLKANPVERFRDVVKFMDWELNEDRLEAAVAATKFENLRTMEEKQGFAEKSLRSRSGRFFRSGVAGAWPQRLTKQQAARIIEHHGTVMQQLGYEIPDLDAVYAADGLADIEAGLSPRA